MSESYISTAYIEQIETRFAQISEERKKTLSILVDYLTDRISTPTPVLLNFICTHNSRRSHFSQIWAQVAANHFGFDQVNCFSGGTETSAVYPSVIKALQQAGLSVQQLSAEANLVYAIKWAPNVTPLIGFSKTYDHPFNPESEFAAIMTCAHAEQNCPFIPTATQRIAIPYEDPKMYDGQADELEQYVKKSLEIATEMFYVFSAVKVQMANA